MRATASRAVMPSNAAQSSTPPTARRWLIVNADDFGRSSGINRGVACAREGGIVTSASLMVLWPAAAEAAQYARQDPDLSLGLHVDLGEWSYDNGQWTRVYEVVAGQNPTAIAREVLRQLAAFRALVGRDPTHLDSHQHVHREEPVRSILQQMARRLGIPLRECVGDVQYCGDFYGQTAHGAPYPEGITIRNLLRILASLRPGVTELGCHPGCAGDVDSIYGRERAQEVRVLCDARVRTALRSHAVELCNFKHVAQVN
jgi:chitin disaccharide deacetylase